MRRAAATFGIVALLSGCTAAVPPTQPVAQPTSASTSEAAVTPSPSASPTVAPTDPDLLLTVDFVAKTAATGAQLHVTLLAYRPVLGSTPRGKELTAKFTQQCSSSALHSSKVHDSMWFTPVEITAEQVPGTPAWPRSQGLWELSYTTYFLVEGSMMKQLTINQINPHSTHPGIACGYSGMPTLNRAGVAHIITSHGPSNSLAKKTEQDSFVYEAYAFFTHSSSPDARSSFVSCTSTLTEAGKVLVAGSKIPFIDYSTRSEKKEGGQTCGMGMDNYKL
jgi:hypothetical protein